MFWPDYSSFYERKTAHSGAVFSLKAQEKKRRGYLLWFVMYPKQFKRTTYEKQ